MKKFFTQSAIFFFTFSIYTGSIYAQTFSWVTGGGTVSSTIERVSYMCTDPNGNIYALSIVGNDPVTADTFSAISGGVNPNILLTSYNCSGQMRWAKLLQNNGYNDKPYGIQADSLGNIYVAGYFDADGGVMQIGTDTSIGPPASDYVTVGLIRFDTSGHFKWIRYVGDHSLVSLAGLGSLADPLAIDGANNVHYFCYMKTGVPLMTGDTSVYGVYDVTYNTGGNLLSAVRLDLDSQWFLHGAVIDPATNKLYVCGEINQDLSGGTATDTFYAAAFDASRNLLWQYFAGHGDDDGFTGIALDQNKYLHFCGSAALASFIFNGDTVSNTHYTSGDISVLMTTDTNGTVKWLKHYDGDIISGFNAITLLPNNKIAAIGTFVGEVIDEGGVNVITPPGYDYAPYFVIVDSAGNLQTMQQTYGIGEYNDGYATAADKVGNLYIGGDVQDSIWAGSPPIPAYYSVGGTSDFFVMKYGFPCSCTSLPVAAYTSTGTDTISFTYTGTTFGVDSVTWNFGDGNTDTGMNPVHTFADTGSYTVCVTVYTDCGNDSSCSTVVIPPLGVPSLSLANVRVFPNPTNDKLFINGILQNTSYRLLDVTGECMQQGVLKGGSNTLSLKTVVSGIYILEMTGTDGERNMVRVVKE